MNEPILIVEDSSTQAMLLENILQRHNFQITIVSNAIDALKWLSYNKPKLVISDIVMPGMNGFELCQKIKSNPSMIDISVVLLTSLTGTEELIEGLSAGADSFITKPYDQEYLVQHITKILSAEPDKDGDKKTFGLEIIFEGKKRMIQAEQKQMIKLLLNVYEGAIQQNTQLLQTQEQLKFVNENLESVVQDRTSELLAKIESSKKIEESLRESDAKFNTLVSKIPVGVYILRSKPNGSYNLEYVSPRMAQILDLSIENLKADGDAIFKVVYPDDLDEVYKLNREGIRLIRPFDWKGRVIVKGQIKWVQLSSIPQQLENGDILWHGLIVDITESKEADEKIRLKNEELLKVNAEKDKFFSIIAHDLRSPLSSFLGFTELMVEDLPNMKLENLQEMAVSMQSTAESLYRLLENLLQWAKIQRGMVTYDPEVFSLLKIVNESLTMVQELVQRKNITIHCDIPAGLEVFVDSNILQTVLRNLISNAAKFTCKGGSISLAAKASDSQQIEVSVSDTGIGMSPEMLNHLFEINNKLNHKGTEGEQSSGLGLILCKELVEKLGGRIWVESQEGVGSQFSFTINQFMQEKTNPPIDIALDHSELMKSGGLNILIADDDEASARLISLIVRSFASKIIRVKNGVEEVEAFKDNPDVDLIITDIRMPEMDGYEAVRKIRKINNNVVIIALTDFAQTGEKSKARRIGCNDYLAKPIQKDKLQDMIKKYF